MIILSIGLHESQDYCAYWKHFHGLNYPVLSDIDGEVWALFGMGYVPHFAVIGCNHKLLYTNFGFHEDLILDELNEELTKTFGLQHHPHADTELFNQDIPLEVQVSAGTTFIEGYPVVAWSTDGVNFSEITMQPDRWDLYTASLPGQPSGTDIYYYLDLRNEHGCDRMLPHNAPHGYYSFHIGPDNTMPMIDHEYREQVSEYELPFIVSAQVNDNLGIQSVILEYSINGSGYQSLQMTEDQFNYTGTIPSSLMVGDTVSYRILATDASMNQNQSSCPESGFFSTTINNKVPALVIDLDYKHTSGPVIHSDINDLGIYAEYTTFFPTDLNQYEAVFVCQGVYGDGYVDLIEPHAAVLRTYLMNGGSAYLEGSFTWCDWPTTAHPLFRITCDAIGLPMIPSVSGTRGSFAQGFSMLYPQDPVYNNYSDQLAPAGEAVVFLESDDPEYPVGIACSHPVYKTVGMSILYAGLAEANNDGQPQEFLEEVLTFLEVIETEPTPTPVPTSTPVPPTPTYTPEPTPTPSPEPAAMAEIVLNQTAFTANDPFNLDLQITNTIEAKSVDLYLVLDIQGVLFYYWPSWLETPESQSRYLEMGTNVTEPILSFTWPANAGTGSNLRFWSVMISQESGEMFGDFHRVDWSFY